MIYHIPSETLQSQKDENENLLKETPFALNEATKRSNISSNHRRRHTIDHIPTFYSKITKGSIQPLSPAFGGNNSAHPIFKFDKPTKLPFLADQKANTTPSTTVQSSFVEITENEENQSSTTKLSKSQQNKLRFHWIETSNRKYKEKIQTT